MCLSTCICICDCGQYVIAFVRMCVWLCVCVCIYICICDLTMWVCAKFFESFTHICPPLAYIIAINDTCIERGEEKEEEQGTDWKYFNYGHFKWNYHPFVCVQKDED